MFLKRAKEKALYLYDISMQICVVNSNIQYSEV